MKEKYEKILRIIYDVGRTPIPPTDIGISGEAKTEVCEWLLANGYIENLNYRGMFCITCDITQKAIEYFAGK